MATVHDVEIAALAREASTRFDDAAGWHERIRWGQILELCDAALRPIVVVDDHAHDAPARAARVRNYERERARERLAVVLHQRDLAKTIDAVRERPAANRTLAEAALVELANLVLEHLDGRIGVEPLREATWLTP